MKLKLGLHARVVAGLALVTTLLVTAVAGAGWCRKSTA